MGSSRVCSNPARSNYFLQLKAVAVSSLILIGSYSESFETFEVTGDEQEQAAMAEWLRRWT